MRFEYNELKKITDADNAFASIRLEELAKEIAEKDGKILSIEREITQVTEQNAELSEELRELQNSEPVQPELESQPLVISLRKQVGKLTEMYSLSQQLVNLKSDEIVVLKGKCLTLESVGSEWKAMYERERSLRLASEGLFKVAEHELRVSKSWGKAKNIAIVTVAGCLAYSIFKKG